jgi:hypothetical protein
VGALVVIIITLAVFSIFVPSALFKVTVSSVAPIVLLGGRLGLFFKDLELFLGEMLARFLVAHSDGHVYTLCLSVFFACLSGRLAHG